ncbi:amidase [Methylobacterium persicinum]|uniref:Indoleacetamide hydrolase n=1 Tax=Methylobacterium persicinum TaxID=374426 RepID=A0ABU0HK45_9HYPH|nr:amidase [Methylobacterium persicinum]MDQ0442682.1 aspartyl-tRNA(Asn)/glutamyl-tRNA(Gln) amidotransferase subunit A [Methylobacterium persicinum]GJE37071.1 Glutamyl-tRNA(Gln) amidotransferase subunit A [Methylobacterium persicinum]
MTDALCGLPITELARRIAAGELSSTDLVGACLDRIGRLDGDLKSFVCLSSAALDAARAADAEIARSGPRGPLHGIPVGIKDNYTSADLPTRAGTAVEALTFPREDSHAVAKLRAAGAIILGKLRMHEFAWGMVTPPTRNPWDLNRVPGGSSGGSGAAVAARLCPAALGSDTGGSIRIPAALCGVVGLKPTYGRIGRSGIVPHSWSLDHAGPLTRTVADAALLLQTLAGPDQADPATASVPLSDYTAGLGDPVRGLRVAVIRNHFFDAVDEDVATAVEGAIRFFAEKGCTVRDVTVPSLRYGLGAIYAIELSSSTAYHDRSLAQGHVAGFAEDVRDLVEMGRFVTGPDYLRAEQARALIMAEMAAVLDRADVIVTPASPLTAWRTDESAVTIAGRPESVLAASWRLTYPFNLTGLPAIALPCGLDRRGLPISLQIAAKPFAEAMLLRVAHGYEQSHDWWRLVPPFADRS